jgi:hypothetical protein
MDAHDASSGPDADPLALDEETVERLLAGGVPPGEVPVGYAEVAELLTAVVAAPSQEELAGKAKALAELEAVTRARQAGLTPRRAGRPPRRRRVGLAVVVVVGALVTGGAAAAATGQLPGPVRDAARSILGAAGAEPVSPLQAGSSPAPMTQNTDAGSAGAGAQGPQSTGHDPGTLGSGPAASSKVKGLCRAYVAGKGDEQGKKLDAAAFEALARAAGGADRIPAYCQEVDPDSPEISGREHGPEEQPGDPQHGGPPASTGRGNPGHGGPSPSSNAGNPGQEPPDTRPHAS